MKRIAIILLTVIIFGGMAVRIISLNWKYPAPEVVSAATGEKIKVGGYQLSLKSREWKDGAYLRDKIPDYDLLKDYDGRYYPQDQVKMLMTIITVEKADDSQEGLDITEIDIESGAWHNGIDIELMEEFNEEDIMMRDLRKGEHKELIIPIFFNAEDFYQSDWNTIEKRKFYMVFTNYPEKKMIEI